MKITIRALSWVVVAVAAITLALGSGLVSPALAQTTQQQPYPGESTQPSGTGPIRLRQNPAAIEQERRPVQRQPPRRGAPSTDELGRDGVLRPYPQVESRPGEFERYVQRLVDTHPEVMRDSSRVSDELRDTQRIEIRRLGTDLVTDGSDDAQEFSPLVPPDYVLAPGDEVWLTAWGSVDADLLLLVDRAGRISVPRVGTIPVAGTRYGDLAETISRRFAQVFKNFQLSVSLGRLRGVRVFVTGFVQRPGAYSMSSLSTVVQAVVRAGGPSAAGSFRNVQLKRGNQAPVTLDLYDLLLKGERGADRPLQADDVVHVGAVGPLVALIGSVNKPAVFELKPAENVGDVLRMAGGYTAVADTSRLAVERLDERSGARITQLPMPQSTNVALRNGDVLLAFSAVSVALPAQQQNKRVRVEGEVLRPGEYVLPPASTIADALRTAGGLTPIAYVFGTEFSRESVRLTQQDNYERALRDLETEFARASTTQRVADAGEAAALQARSTATQQLIQRLRAVRPNGRIVLQIAPEAPELPDLALEDGDRLYIPPRPTTVGVFGSVFNGGSYLHSSSRTLADYLRLAGGPTRGADDTSAFVVRANGSVFSARQNRGWWTGDDRFASLAAEPGDTVFVPEEINKTTFVQGAKDWTQIIYQLGLGLAGIAAIRN